MGLTKHTFDDFEFIELGQYICAEMTTLKHSIKVKRNHFDPNLNTEKELFAVSILFLASKNGFYKTLRSLGKMTKGHIDALLHAIYCAESVNEWVVIVEK